MTVPYIFFALLKGAWLKGSSVKSLTKGFTIVTIYKIHYS